MLAGGRSQRFGSDKALFCVNGEPLVVRTARVLERAGLRAVLVGKEARHLGWPELIEPKGVWHPLWGLAEALLSVHDGTLGADMRTHAFIAACDLEDLGVDQVRALLQGRALARGQPLCGVVPTSIWRRARAIAQASGPVRTLLGELPELDVGAIRNLNHAPTPG